MCTLKRAVSTEFTVWQLSESHVTEICGHKLLGVYHPFKGAKCLHMFVDLVLSFFNSSRPSLHKEIVHIPLAQKDKPMNTQ